jgi:hypothetical protein
LKKDAGMDIAQSGAMAKLFASQTAMDTTTKRFKWRKRITLLNIM